MSEQVGRLFFPKIAFDWNFQRKKVCNKFGTNNCNRFDKLFYKNLDAVKWCQGTIVRSGRFFKFSWKADCHVFIALMGDWYKSFPHLSFYKVLRIHLGMLPGKSLSPSLRLSYPFPPLAPAFKLPHLLLSWGQILYRSYEAFVHPEPKTPLNSVQAGPKSPSRLPNLLPLICPAP